MSHTMLELKKQADELFTRLMEQCAPFEKRYGPTPPDEIILCCHKCERRRVLPSMRSGEGRTRRLIPCHKCETPLDYLGYDDDGEIWWCVGCQAYRAALE